MTAFILLAVCGSPLSAQQRKKKDEIKVPPKALEASVDAEYFKNKEQAFRTWLESFAFAKTVKEFQANYEEHKSVLPGDVQERITSFRKDVVTHPELEEVTGISKNWYVDIYNKSIELLAPVQKLTAFRQTPDEAMYRKIKEDITKKRNAVLELMDSKKTKLSKAELLDIKKKNVKERKAAYIKTYKMYQAYEAKKAREAAAAAAAAKKKKNKR